MVRERTTLYVWNHRLGVFFTALLVVDFFFEDTYEPNSGIFFDGDRN